MKVNSAAPHHGWGEHRQRHPQEGARPGGTQRKGSLPQRFVQALERGRDEQVEVDVHGVGVHPKDGRNASQGKGRLGQAEQHLEAAGQDAALAIEKKEGDHPDQGRQQHRQRGQGGKDAPPGKVEAVENERQRDADEGRQQHAPQRDEQAVAQGLHLGGTAEKCRVVGQREPIVSDQAPPQDKQVGIEHQPQQQPEYGQGQYQRRILGLRKCARV